MKIKLPSSLSEISVSEYQKLLRVYHDIKDEKTLSYEVVSLFIGLNKSEVYKLPFNYIEDMMVSISSALVEKPKTKLIQRFEIEGVEYGFIPNLNNASFGEYIDLDNYLKVDDKYHELADKFMAVAYRPITYKNGNKYNIQEYNGTENLVGQMRFAPADVYLSAVVFFCDLSKELLTASSRYLNQMERQPAQSERTLARGGDGTEAFTVLLNKISRNTSKLLAYHYPKPLLHYRL